MNVDSRVITLALFLIAQSVGAIWWASGLSSEVERLAGVLMITDEQTCIAFSGEDRKEFIRPPDHPMGEANEDTKA